MLKFVIMSFVIILLGDFIWLTIQSSLYNRMVSSVQGKKISFKVGGAIIAYLLMFLSLIFIIYPLVFNDKSTNNKLMLAIKYAGVFGFLVYGIYNATNYAIFDNYMITVALFDTVWGTFIYSISVYLSLLVLDK